MNKHFFLLLYTFTLVTSNLFMNAATPNSPTGKRTYSQATKGQQPLTVDTTPGGDSDWQQTPQGASWDEAENGGGEGVLGGTSLLQPLPLERTSPKRSPLQSPQSNTPGFILPSPKNDAASEESIALEEKKLDSEKQAVVVQTITTNVNSSEKIVDPSWGTWFGFNMPLIASRRSRIKQVLEIAPLNSSLVTSNLQTIAFLQEVEQEADQTGKALGKTNPQYVTKEDKNLKSLNRILKGCQERGAKINPLQLEAMWRVLTQTRDGQIEYLDQDTQATAMLLVKQIAGSLSVRNPLIEDLTKSQHLAEELCAAVNSNPNNSSASEKIQWNPQQTYSRLKINNPIKFNIPNSRLRLKLDIALEEQSEEESAV